MCSIKVDKNKGKLRQLPGVDMILKQEKIAELVSQYGQELITYAIRKAIDDFRNDISTGKRTHSIDKITLNINKLVKSLADPSLKKVINATGVIIHTNLGRAPLG